MRQPLTLVALLLSALTAHGMCAAPSPYLLPRPGTPLPVNPSLFLVVPPDARSDAVPFIELMRAVEESGKELALTVKVLEDGDDLQVLRLDVVAPQGTRFHVTMLPFPDLEGGAMWVVQSGVVFPRDLQVARGKDVFSSWTCSFESSRVLDTSIAAPAYRVEFAETEAALRAGKGTSAVVEGDGGGFLWRDGKRPEPLQAVRLGHHNCWGSNLKWKSTSLAVRVTALLSDGSERKSDKVFVLDAPRAWSSRE